MAPLVAVAAYILATVPLLAILLAVHRVRSDYTGWFIAALVIQIVPLGLLIFPFGFVGIVMLGFTLALALRRNRRFRALKLDSPEVHRRWTLEAIANALALGFALEQKLAVWLFLEATAGHSLRAALTPLLAGSLGIWALVGALAWTEARHLPGRDRGPASSSG